MHAVRRAVIYVGDHTVLFAGPGERIELDTWLTAVKNFCQRGVVAAKWLCKPETRITIQ
jgi:dihydrodipicolinate reductase